MPSAQTADNANALGGKPASAYQSAGRPLNTGVVKLSGTMSGQTVPVINYGPFKVTFTCTDMGGGNFQASIDGTSSEANSVLQGTVVAVPGTSQNVLTASGTTASSDDELLNFQAPGGANLQLNTKIGVNNLGANCWYAVAGNL